MAPEPFEAERHERKARLESAEDEEAFEENHPEEARPIGEVEAPEVERIPTRIPGLDLLLEGGLPRYVFEDGQRRGTSILLWGSKGTGKTRISLSMLSGPARRSGAGGSRYRCSYVTGEEVDHTISLYAKQLGLSPKIKVLATHNLDLALETASKSDIVILDSAQTFEDPSCDGRMGGIRQVRNVIHRVLGFVRQHSTIVVLVSQVNKKGEAASSNELGHLTDMSLRLANNGKSDRSLIIADKNRFGKSSGIWRFCITEGGFNDRQKRAKKRKPPSAFDAAGAFGAGRSKRG